MDTTTLRVSKAYLFLSVRGEVFFVAPESDFRFHTIPGDNDAGDLFN